ncbi:type II toxin-antitoxin system VapC family toxin [Aquipuribacter sp. SD81]|uniref:type II toxin-antitoxin system VapC family toxin n=1 Tax=Aquipuribacter sp. SD81 TaxID=3127703 RepID=UPI003015E43E
MIVLDASALVEVVVARPDRHWVVDLLAVHEPAAPAHQLVEVTTALAVLGRRGVLSPDEVDAAAVAAAELPQRVEPVDADLVQRALALRRGGTVAAALYVALAERLDVPLLTTDPRLAWAVPTGRVLAPEPWPGRTRPRPPRGSACKVG